MANYVAYNPNDTAQTSFLSALALGETGNSSYASTEGFGGVNLSGATTDANGFPLQSPGTNVSSAAGTFQFLQGTYDQVAAELGLDNSFSQSDQNQAAWQLAQNTYAAKTGGSLYDALKAGNYQSVQSALTSIWPSVSGNGSAPQGLAHSLEAGLGANVPFPPLTAERQTLLAMVTDRLNHRGLFSAILKTGLNASAS